jgi:hypothetical protein
MAASWDHTLAASNERRLRHSKHKADLRGIAKRAENLADALKSMNSELVWQIYEVWPHLASKDS